MTGCDVFSPANTSSLKALVNPTDGLTTVKAYFRANLYPQFFYVEMVLAGDVYQGVLPKPSPEITGLHYYLEAMDSSFNSVRTAEYTPEVVSNETSCREQNPTPAAYLDGAGAITVGSTGGGSAMPSGFLSEGIAATIPAIGRTTGGSGLLIGGGVAAAGAAVGVGVLVAGGENSTTTNPGWRHDNDRDQYPPNDVDTELRGNGVLRDLAITAADRSRGLDSL